MDYEKTKDVILEASETSENLRKLDRDITHIEAQGINFYTTYGAGITHHLDSKTKAIVKSIVMPELEAKREELTNYLNELLTGGIVK